jgi:hypothetical protein
MKKLIIMLLIMVIVLGFASCGGGEKPAGEACNEGASSPIDDTDVLEAIGLGTVQMTVPGSGVFTNYDEKFAVMNLPYLFESKEQMDAAFNGKFGELIGSWLEEY